MELEDDVVKEMNEKIESLEKENNRLRNIVLIHLGEGLAYPSE